MALFTDGTVPTIDDLLAEDSSLLDVASSEGIDVTRKIASARDELGVEIEARMAHLGGADQSWRGAAGIDNVVVTAPLKLWHIYRALELVYRDAYSSQLNDRYKAKRDQYRQLSSWAQDKLQQTGTGLVQSPVPRANQPAVQLIPGGLTENTYFVTMAWVNGGGEEGAIAAPVVVSVQAGTGFQVQPPPAPTEATGWVVYVGVSVEAMIRQNQEQLRVSDAWTQLTAPASTGSRPGTGQSPNYLRPLPRIWQRG
jgi:hypothetical protein